MRRERLPRAVQSFFSSRHGPGRVSFVQKRFAPFDQLIVDLSDDLRPKRVVAPMRECEPMSQRRFVALYDRTNPITQILKGEDGLQAPRNLLDPLIHRIEELCIERLHGRRTEAVDQTGLQDVVVCDPAQSDIHVGISSQWLQGRIEMVDRDSARTHIPAIDITGQIPIPSHELLAAPDGFLERQILKTMERIVMYERPHRPVLGDDFSCELDDPSQLHPSGFDVDRRGYLFHANNPVTALVSAGAESGPHSPAGITPNAMTISTTISSATNSDC